MLGRVRAVDCWCGYLVQGENDEEVETRLRAHVGEQHANEKRSDEDVRARVADRGYEPPTGDPPWAY
jgi:predicted small metal-binding protein